MKHICIVGAGLAGACAAAALAPHAAVTLLDARGPAAGASGVAAGLANPFMGRRALPAWQGDAALAALAGVLEQAGLGTAPCPLVHPARDAAQAALFAGRAAEHPGELVWREARGAADAWPLVAAPHGALEVRRGFRVDLPALVEALIQHLSITCRWGERGRVVALDADRGRVTTAAGDSVEADRVLLCTGGALPLFQPALPLHRVKGQTITLHAPGIAPLLPTLTGETYLVPAGDGIVVGSTFEHAFADEAPTPEGIAGLRARAARLVPALAGAPVVAARAGVRATVPGRRRPLVGPVTPSGRVWAFNGLGARGLVTAPLLAAGLWGYLHAPETLPAEVRPPRVA